MNESTVAFSAELVAEDGTRIPLDGEQTVGRSEDCDITVDNSRVSRKHAVLRVSDGEVTVEDLGSANGTLLNQRQVQGVASLKNGDSLHFEKTPYTVAITGAEEPVEDSDATVVNMDFADGDATVVNMDAAEPAPQVSASPAAAADLPGSWVDSGAGGDHTKVVGLDDAPGGDGAGAAVARMSDLPHLIVLNADGSAQDGLELEPGDEGSDVWEIGREPSCEIELSDPSVSGRHAQLIHEDGRWRLVNLVSANGIFVNGEKRLSAFLADGDEIRLGHARVVFRAGEGAAAAPARKAAQPSASAAKPEQGGRRMMTTAVIGGVVLVALIAALVLLA